MMELSRLGTSQGAEIANMDDVALQDDLNTTVHDPGSMGYNKLFGLGSEIISAPRAYSSLALGKKFKVGNDGRIMSVVKDDELEGEAI